MSGPSQNAESTSRRLSGLPDPLNPEDRARGNNYYKKFGQEYQFAETWSNPLPEIVVSSVQTPAPTTAATAAIAGASQSDGAQDDNIDSETLPHRTSSSKESTGGLHEAVWVPPPEKPWYKRIPKMWWMIAGISVIGVVAVLLAILGAMGMLGNHTMPDGSNSSSNATSSTTTSAPSTTSTRPASTNLPAGCTDSSAFIKNATWIGLTDTSTYTGLFDRADSAEACCNKCFDLTAAKGTGNGCAGWLYNGSSVYTPCTKIMITRKGAKTDDKCGNGYADETTIQTGSGSGETVAGMGPCSLKETVNS
ncbi:hypothetical protein B0H67DRAFT_27640 [Lasiosphaeris hirsuta]|uniref:Uncharacterized protein n=1 Tax=Lasiosphaeris hirsuta TaxID=260670 RepID=A0AA40B9V7_9PEZI|nr:hypothetical protein B0H67DRAFT_27640 [Lasiosphaeris hirsuta]